jgi:ATP-dependent RNA helicase DDX54/DBP10
VEYLQILLELAGIGATYIYSNLDPTARKINAAKFAAKKVNVMVVTDLAARGIDIPLLDNVINYHFPAKSKLFVHRVGRVARAGRTGTAYSLVATDEMAYFIDLQLFLGGSPALVPLSGSENLDWNRLLGRVPQTVNEEYADQLTAWHRDSADLVNATKVAENGYKQYLHSRPGASVESVKRTKDLKAQKMGDHPLLRRTTSAVEAERTSILEQMKNFRPKSTIFEVGNTTKNKEVIGVMATKRKKHGDVIEQNSKKAKFDEGEIRSSESSCPSVSIMEKSSEEDIVHAFETVVRDSGKKTKLFGAGEKKKNATARRDENFIPYQPSDMHTEAGYNLTDGFSSQVLPSHLTISTGLFNWIGIGQTGSNINVVGNLEPGWSKGFSA